MRIVSFTEARNALKAVLDGVVNDADTTVITHTRFESTHFLHGQRFGIRLDHEMVMDEGMFERLKVTLTEKIEQLNMDYQELQHGGDIKSIIWQRFGGGNKASRQKGLREYSDNLHKEAQDLLAECQEIKTVKQLQLRLKQRIETSRFNNPFFQIDPSELFS